MFSILILLESTCKIKRECETAYGARVVCAQNSFFINKLGLSFCAFVCYNHIRVIMQL